MSSLVDPVLDTATRTMSYGEAIYEATVAEMRRDERVFVMGQGVDDARGMFGTTLGLHEEFGPTRNFDVPLAEEGMTGVGIGAALAGMRPIQVHQRMDFMLVCMNQLLNMAAKQRYMFDGAHSVPMVVRGIIGRSWGQGAQHSQAFHSFFMHVPGLKVLAPTTPHDAKAGMLAAIRDDNPVIMVEHRMLHPVSGVVGDDDTALEFGRARVLSEGTDVTIVGISHMAVECARAKRLLATAGISAEIVDPVSLAPLDSETIAASVAKTGRLLVVDNGWTTCGAGSEIALRTLEHLGGGVPFARMGYLPTPCPTTRFLEDLFYPEAGTIATRAHELVTGEPGPTWDTSALDRAEITEFRGPF